MTYTLKVNGLNFKTNVSQPQNKCYSPLWQMFLTLSQMSHALKTRHQKHSGLVSQPHFGQSGRMQLPLPKVGDLESSGTPENSEDNLKGQISLHWCALHVIGKISKCRCPKWPRISHLDICSPSYGQKKGRESNWQFNSWPLKVKNRPLPDIWFKSAT